MFIISAVFWVIRIAVTVLVSVITYLTPALFQAAVYLEWQLVQAVEQLTGFSPAHGLIILLSLACIDRGHGLQVFGEIGNTLDVLSLAFEIDFGKLV